MVQYYVSEWALRRKAEMIDLPDHFDVHADYLDVLCIDRIILAFQSIGEYGEIIPY